ncbi:MAG: 23S rRNA (guanosine(2251)-2'-O)-methyltransferase RlmB [Candidatus Vogelbacteria bacterium]|nr:23S rRNA (guanosine(2251)-2'-O)-methyltransferase RlmB [Candidatus Vogelbacteria bacterium]
MKRDTIYIYGKHAVLEAAAHAPHTIKKIFLSDDSAVDQELSRSIQKAGIAISRVRAREIGKTVGESATHQGIIASISPEKLMHPFSDFISTTPLSGGTALLLLDGLEDPHNVGAVIRSAAAFGISAVLIPERRQAPLTGAVIKVSAGMAFRVPLVSIGGATTAVIELQKAGFKIYALTMDGELLVSKEDFSAPSVFVIGNESAGISAKVVERADSRLRIPMNARTESLNAAVSAAIVMYEWSTQHPEALRI